MSMNGPSPPPTAPSARRINRGRGHSYELDFERVPGITTVLDKGVPKPALINWAADETAGYAVDHWAELDELTPSKRLAVLQRARFETRDAAAVRGTNVHAIAQRLAAGEELDVPEELIGHVDAYLGFVRDWQPVEILVEAPVFSRRWRYAGTPDLFATLADGKTWILDWKTSAKGIFPDNVLQLAAARFAEFVVVDGVEVPVPEVDAAGCVWLRADGYDLVPVAADEQAFRVFLYARQVHDFAMSEREDWIGDVLPPLEVAS